MSDLGSAQHRIATLRAEERWSDLASALREEAGKDSDQDRRVPLLLELAQLYHLQLGRPAMANLVLGEVVAGLPDDLALLDAAIDVHTTLGRSREAVALLERKASLLGDAAGAVEVHLRIARLHIESGARAGDALHSLREAQRLAPGDPRVGNETLELARAGKREGQSAAVMISLWEAVCEQAPDPIEALRELPALYVRQREWRKLVEVSGQLGRPEVPEADQIRILQMAATAAEEHLQDPDCALDLWGRVAALAPENRFAPSALRRLYLVRRDWDALEALMRDRGALRDLAGLLEREVDRAEGPDQSALLLRIGQLHLEMAAASSTTRAVRAFEQLRALEPNNLDACRALTGLYEPGRQGRALIEVLAVLARAAADDPSIIPLLHGIRQISQDQLGDPQQAIAVYSAILEHDGDDGPTLSILGQLYARTGRWTGDHAGALDWYMRVLELEPEDQAALAEVEKLLSAGDVAVQLRAARSLEQTRMRTGQEDQLAPAYEVLARHAEAPGAVAALLLDAALSWRARGEPDRAFDALRRALLTDPEAEPAASALAELAGQLERWDELAEVYREVARQPLTPASHKRIRLQLARLYRDKLGDFDRAIRSYQSVLDLSFSLDLMDELAALLRREGRLDELSERLRGRRDLTSDRETRRAIDLRLAEVERERLARAEPAEQAAQALELARFYEEDLEDDRVAHEILLTQILHAEVIDRAFIDRFRGLAERSGDWDTFLVTCEDLARRVEGRDRMAALELWLELAERYGRQRGNIASALIAAERASRLDPARLDALVLRTEFHSRAGEWNQALALLEQQLALPTEEPERARILQAMSELLEDQLAQPARAAECCQQLIAIAGPSLEVVTRLERCYRRTADWPALLSTYELHITLAPTEEQRVEVIDEIAKLYGERRIQSPP